MRTTLLSFLLLAGAAVAQPNDAPPDKGSASDNGRVEQLPPRGRLYLAARCMPQLPVGRLLADGRLLLLDIEQLRMDWDESLHLLRRVPQPQPGWREPRTPMRRRATRARPPPSANPSWFP